MATKKVIIIWSNEENLLDGQVNVLTWSGGTRIYEKDKLDGRLLTSKQPKLPYFKDIESAVDYMRFHPNDHIQLDLELARMCDLV